MPILIGQREEPWMVFFSRTIGAWLLVRGGDLAPSTLGPLWSFDEGTVCVFNEWNRRWHGPRWFMAGAGDYMERRVRDCRLWIVLITSVFEAESLNTNAPTARWWMANALFLYRGLRASRCWRLKEWFQECWSRIRGFFARKWKHA